MNKDTRNRDEMDAMSDAVLAELTRRVQDIDNSYRAVAEKMGQLYMLADENKITALTTGLDKPMRNASDNEQMFAAILDDLRVQANRRKSA